MQEVQKKVYNIVLEAQKKAIEAARPGVDLPEIHKVASISLIDGLISLGVLSGNHEDIFKKGEHKKYYPHGTGHWLGLDVHDQCPYLDDQINNITLQENMYFTVEPGLYFDEEDTSLPKELRGIGIRIEDDILITKNGNEVITKDIPKEVSEVEEACQKDFLSYF